MNDLADDHAARQLLERIGILRNPCDLDLLIFFARHPRSLLPSELLSKFLGYELKEIADSLDVLLAASLIHRTQASTHAARLYAFASHPANGDNGSEPLRALVAFASTRAGRLILRQVLAGRRREPKGSTAGPDAAERPGPRRIVSARHPRTAAR